MLSKPMKDCGCGGGKSHCISKPENRFRAWIRAELKRLDCGCGCQGRKAFAKKYGKLIGGAILADCPPGWRNDGLTCVENCRDDERDDGLTCRKKCEPGWIDDGLTCRKPITSSMNACPDGSQDIWGTCWGPVREDCIDDCFTKPAPGCRSWWCGRLRGAFGEDWGPKLCTSCDARCGQTCWKVQGITKQLHQRELRLAGGEVIGQPIRGKQIRGRVNWDELGKTLETGIKDLMEGNIDLAAAFDPERNGINAAFRKFGDDINGALREIESGIKAGFDKMGADAKAAFEKLARDAETTFKQFGDELVAKLKNPDFWVEFAAIMTEVALYAAAAVVTATGVGAAFAPGLLAAAAMAGPAIRMIGDAAQGRPIDALDIAELAIAGASAAIPGLSGVTKTVMKVSTQAAKVAVTIVKAGQDLGMIPSSCLGPNCPPPPFTPTEPDPPLNPPFPAPPPPPGQLTDEEIEALQPANTIKRKLQNPKRDNPDWISTKNWIAQYRRENYGDNITEEPGNGALKTPEDELIDKATTIPVTTPPTQIPDGEELFKPEDDEDAPLEETTPFDEDAPLEETTPFDEDAPLEETTPFDEDAPLEETTPFDEDAPLEETTPFDEDAPVETQVTIPKVPEPTRIISEEEVESDSFIPRAIVGGLRGGAIEDLPLIEMNVQGDNFSNPWGTMTSTRPKSTKVIPVTHTGAEFNPECYARKNPEIAQQVGNDPGKLTTHWMEIGAIAGMDADCGNTPSTLEQRLAAMAQFESNRIKYEGMKTNCAATDRFWVENENRCDGMRHKDGRPNADAGQCVEGNSQWNSSGPFSFCNPYLLPDGNWKSQKDICNLFDNYWDGSNCIQSKNVDGSQKTKADVCTGINAYWDGMCNVDKDRDGKLLENKKICNNVGNFWGKAIRIFEAFWGRQHWGDWNRSINVTDNIRNELKMRNNGLFEEIYLPPVDVNGLRGKYGWRDVSPYEHKVLTIRWFDGIQNRENAHIEGQSFPELAPVGHAPIECMTEFHPGGLANSDAYRAKVREYVPFPIDQNQKRDAYNRIAGQVGSGKPKSLTLYWAEWCPHCHDLMPEWEKLGDGYKGVKIEAIEEQDSDVKVDGYPTIIFHDGRNMEKYEGERTKNAILKFLKNKLSIK